jgi:hypothetical protein
MWDYTVAPLSSYDVLLGTKFLTKFDAQIHVRDRALTLTNLDGTTIRITGGTASEDDREERSEVGTRGAGRLGWRQLTASITEQRERVAMRQEHRWRAAAAAREANDRIS